MDTRRSERQRARRGLPTRNVQRVYFSSKLVLLTIPSKVETSWTAPPWNTDLFEYYRPLPAAIVIGSGEWEYLGTFLVEVAD
jgi:hypothetical protein